MCTCSGPFTYDVMYKCGYDGMQYRRYDVMLYHATTAAWYTCNLRKTISGQRYRLWV